VFRDKVSNAGDAYRGVCPCFFDEFFTVSCLGQVLGIADPFGKGGFAVAKVMVPAVAAMAADGSWSAVGGGQVQGHAGFRIRR
jgi:hypothetical protein